MFEQDEQKNRNDSFVFDPEDFKDDDELLFDDDLYEEVEKDKEEPEAGDPPFSEANSDSDEELKGEHKGRAVGIDLGTTNSVVAYIDNNGAPRFIKVKNEILIPSYIFYKGNKDIYFGKKAKAYAKALNKDAAVSLFKRHLRADSDKIKVRIPKEEPRGADGKKYYVIDTNVFIDRPDILESFSEDMVAVLPITVEQELEYRTADINTKYSADRALEEIVKYRDRVQFAESDLSLLSEDFFRRFPQNCNNANNDNKILAIAVLFREQNATLISSDKMLVELKADFAGVKGITLKEFNLRYLNNSRFDELELSGTEASAMFLTYLKKETEKALNQPVDKAVITVPATFNIVEIENTRKAGLSAGFAEIHIEKEPTAAAIAYKINADEQASTFIYDFGGGTFDVSIIKSDGDGNFEVCATAGNSKLGGEDLTNRLEEFVYDYLEDQYDLSMYSEEEARLNETHYRYNQKTIYWAAETCKMELSVSESTTMTLMDIYISDTEQKSVFIDMTRTQFEELIKPIINQTIAEMNNGLSKADMMKEDVDHIILAGGTSLIPCVREQVEKYFGRKPSADKNAATLIAEGAAIIADGLYGDNHLIKLPPRVFDMTYEDFGVALETWDYDCIIPAGTALPATRERKYSLVDDEQSQLNIKIFSRRSEAVNSLKTFDEGVEYLDELVMSNIPPMKIEDVDVVVRFEITKEYELKTYVTLIRKDGTVVDKGNLSIDRQSAL